MRNKYKNKNKTGVAENTEKKALPTDMSAEKQSTETKTQDNGYINVRNSVYNSGKSGKTAKTATASTNKSFFAKYKVLIIAFVVLLAAAVITIAVFNRSDDTVYGGGTDKYVVLNLGSENCTYCDMLEPVVEKMNEKYGDTISIRYYDIMASTQGASLANQYGVAVTPTLIFLDKSGREVERRSGYISESQFESIFADLGWI